MANPDAKKDVDPKRKAIESPETDKPFPRLRRRASLPDIQDATDPKTSYSLPELMKRVFMDPEIIKDIVPTMMVQFRPSVEATIQHTMEKTLATTISAVIEKINVEIQNEGNSTTAEGERCRNKYSKTDLKESKKTGASSRNKSQKVIQWPKGLIAVWSAIKSPIEQCSRLNQM